MKYKNTQEMILGEMEDCIKYCSLIKRARINAGFTSLKYPITDVKINRYFSPEYRELIAEDCNIVGYMDIPPVEDVFNYGEPKDYHKEELDGRIVWVCTVKSDWQDDLFQDRNSKRNEAMQRKLEVV